ncbi:MAG TPA: hypothetical protein PLW34_08995 [Termitinemataceae bacterium]|nr:hypothetical protein [Termitinemataceae bacterium]HOM23802.1 hypothetical protein [Termitinemataceae bacterium]HPQ00879.1 hypothetical protein [Termitinemataceae bacterium]
MKKGIGLKKGWLLFFYCMALGGIPYLWAQETIPVTEGTYYRISSRLSAEEVKTLLQEMDGRFTLYNRLFHFSPESLSQKLNLRVFTSEKEYNEYVTSKIGQIREGAVYLHYGDPALNELVLRYPTTPYGKIMAHQSCIQFLRAFIPNPPTWLQEGMAIYFSGLLYNQEKGEFTYEENLSWLPTIKSWGKEVPVPTDILFHDVTPTIPQTKVQGAAWALVSFLLNTDNEEYRRLLYETFILLSPTLDRKANSLLLEKRLGPWFDKELFSQDFLAYLGSRKTFTELIEEGRRAYNEKNYAQAERAFNESLRIKQDHYAPYYYLGLLAYEQKLYDLAEQQYLAAVNYGADKALLNYALGLNALAANKKDAARTYLIQAAEAAPQRYKTKVDEILSRLK